MGTLTVGPNISRRDPAEARVHHILDDELGDVGGFYLGMENEPAGSVQLGFWLGPLRMVHKPRVNVRGTGRGAEALRTILDFVLREFSHVYVALPKDDEYEPAVRVLTKAGFTPYQHPALAGRSPSGRTLLGYGTLPTPPTQHPGVTRGTVTVGGSRTSEHEGRWTLPVFERSRLVGACLLKRSPHEEGAEIVCSLRAGARGRGIGTEATRLCLELAFGQFGERRVWLCVKKSNAPAVKVARALGFTTFRDTPNAWFMEIDPLGHRAGRRIGAE